MYLFSGGFYKFTVASLIVFIIAEGEFFVNKQRQDFSLPLFPLSRRFQHILNKNAVPSRRIVDKHVGELMISAVQQICRYQSSNTTLIFLTRIDLT